MRGGAIALSPLALRGHGFQPGGGCCQDLVRQGLVANRAGQRNRSNHDTEGKNRSRPLRRIVPYLEQAGDKV